jgi:5-methyltetrahydropteroyltriglutamate--homocysteine methyltransferase
VRARELWRVAPEFLEAAQDDATLLAIRAQERAGSTSSPTARCGAKAIPTASRPALEGVDIDNPGTALDRSGHPNPVPRVTGKVRRKHPVEVRDVQFLRRNTDRMIKMTVPGPFTMSQQAQNDFYQSDEVMALDYAAAVNAEIKDLFAAGADVVQIDEPYMQARPEKARQFGLKALNAALDGVTGTTACAHLLRLRGDHPRAAGGLFVSAGIREFIRAADLDRDRAVEARLQGAGEAAGQDHPARRARSLRHDGRNARAGRSPYPACAAARAGRAHRRAPDCGLKYLPRDVAFGKMQAMVAGAAIVRRELQG